MKLLKEEIDRLDVLRRSKPRGTYLGKLVMDQPKDPFHAFRQLQTK